MKSAKEAVIKTVARVCCERGLKRTGQCFELQHLGTNIFVYVQQSRDRVAPAVKLTVNLRVFYPEVDAEFGRTMPPRSPEEGQWHARLRDFGEGRVPEWWLIPDEVSVSEVESQIVEALPRAIDYMKSITPASALRDLQVWKGSMMPDLVKYKERS